MHYLPIKETLVALIPATIFGLQHNKTYMHMKKRQEEEEFSSFPVVIVDILLQDVIG